jgi:multidrug transporter EmrE-like cation transporter
MNLWTLLVIFWSMQIAAYLTFKCGSLSASRYSARWVTSFIIGNAVGTTSIIFLMRIYAKMSENPNIALVLAGVGAGIGCQLAMLLVFRSRLSFVQWTGIALVLAGTAVALLG